jgi:hypothetical protein
VLRGCGVEGERVIGRGVYGAAEALRLLNFRRDPAAPGRGVSRQTVARWLKGYDYEAGGETRHSGPLWRPDYANDDDVLELSFRDLVELRFVKAFRDAGLGLATSRACATSSSRPTPWRGGIPSGSAGAPS